MASTRLTAEYWSNVDCSASDRNFYCFPPIRARASKLVFDVADSRPDWCEHYTIERYLKHLIPVDRALSICCGFGSIERYLARQKVAKRITGIDIAPGAIEAARQRAAAEGFDNIDYQVANLNLIELTAGAYQLIWANGALHHVESLESLVRALHASLTPEGILVANEYVGPNYQQLGERQVEIINAVKHLLPQELRGSNVGTSPPAFRRLLEHARAALGIASEERAIYRKLWEPTPLSWFEQNDPSESIRSSEVIGVLKSVFGKVLVLPFNGSILYYALDEKFFNNFDTGNSRHRKVLEALFDLEDSLIEAGEIGIDNAHLICYR